METNDNIRKQGSFIYSSLLETGVFAMATEDESIYNLVSALLNTDDPSQPGEHIVQMKVRVFVRESETLSFFELSARILRGCGGILLGWKHVSQRYPCLNPRNKHEKLEWKANSGDMLLVLRPHLPNISG